MLNGPASAADAYAPSVMPFIGLEAAAHKQQLWEWDAIATTTAVQQPVPAAAAGFAATTTTYTQQPFYSESSCTLVDCCISPSAVTASSSPSPFPQAVSASFPFYQTATSVVPDYQQAFLSTAAIKDEDVDAISYVDGVLPGTGRIGLNLGRRTYFSSGDAGAVDGMLRRSRGFYGHQYYGYGHFQHQVPRCQAEGCKADLSGAKHYHRRHKVCEFHSKAAIVIASGVQQRFCQQCSRFHVLGEFDETKRSCRKRLAEHNRRRRKPQPQQQQLKPGANSSVSSPPTSAMADASSSDVKNKHIAHNGGQKGPDIGPNASTTTSMAPTTSSSFVSFSAGGETSSAEAHLRASVTGLSLGGTDASGRAASAAVAFGSDDAFHDRNSFLFAADEKSTHQYHEHFQQHKQQQLFSSSSSSSTFAHPHHNFFCPSSNDASQSTTGGCGGGGSDQSVPRSSLLNLGQNLFDVDFME